MNSIAVAELTMGLLLACDRRIPDQTAELKAGKWNKKEYSGKARGLKGMTLGVVGAYTSTATDTKFYYDKTVITGISPMSGPVAGATQVTIIGTGFGSAPTVVFVSRSTRMKPPRSRLSRYASNTIGRLNSMSHMAMSFSSSFFAGT